MDQDYIDKNADLLTRWRATLAETRAELDRQPLGTSRHVPFDIPALATIREAGGRVVGPLNVHASGGVLRFTDLPTMLFAIDQAGRGQPIGIAEGGASTDKRGAGHAWMYLDVNDWEKTWATVDLRGAEVVAWERAPTWWAREMGLPWAAPSPAGAS